MKTNTIILMIFLLVSGASAQKKQNSKPMTTENKINSVPTNASPVELAGATLKVYGGDKFKNMKTLVVRGTADVSGSPTTTFPATFATIYAGEKISSGNFQSVSTV
jgi:hypothetical protein